MTTTHLHDVRSAIRNETVEVSVVLPPGFDAGAPPLPLIISLHGGGGSRDNLVDAAPVFDEAFRGGILRPVCVASFSSGGGSWYGGWEEWILDELPAFMAKTYNARTDRDGLMLTGISMGGYGSLKMAFKYPDRFLAIAAQEPAIEPSYDREPNFGRNTWYRMPPLEELVWGSPFDENKWLADHPPRLARDNADAIRASGIEIYLEVGDEDYIMLHDATEFMHRVLWDHDIRHEYHLVRWADHVGPSLLRPRMAEALRFLDGALAGGRSENTDLPLTPDEQSYLSWALEGGMAAGEPEPMKMDMTDERGPSVHAALWDPLKATAPTSELTRAYAKLPPT